MYVCMFYVSFATFSSLVLTVSQVVTVCKIDVHLEKLIQTHGAVSVMLHITPGLDLTTNPIQKTFIEEPMHTVCLSL
jgi:hypothetical protein